MTEHRWREKDIDHALMLELASGAPSEDRIRELVERGADVNSVKDDESVVMDAMVWLQDGLDERFIRLLVELGADVNYLSDDGGCPLIGACLAGSPALVEYFLQRGANPNVFREYGETVLDEIEEDLWYAREESSNDPACDYAKMARKLEETVPLLRRYGAKSLFELHTTRVSQEIRVFGYYETGLMTRGGHIKVDAIEELTGSFRSHFKAWKEAYWDPWPDNWSGKPASFDRAQHNEWGGRMCRVIRAAFPSDISVAYMTLDAKDEGMNVRTVDWERIE